MKKQKKYRKSKNDLLEDFNKEIKNIINVANSSLGELMKEKDSFFEKLKKIGINKLNENEAKIDDLNQEFNEITNLNIEIKNNLNEKLENIKEEITFKIDNVSDFFNFNINNLIKELSDEDNSTSKDSNNIIKDSLQLYNNINTLSNLLFL